MREILSQIGGEIAGRPPLNTADNFGKETSKTTAQFRMVPLGSFQHFFAISYGKTGTIPRGLGIDMLMNRRASERRECRRVAKIQFGTGSLPRDCMITDISAGGVKVIAEHLEVPPEFTLILSTGSPRQCRLAWRIGCEFGAQFVD